MTVSDESLAALLRHTQQALVHAREEADKRTATRGHAVKMALAEGWSPGRVAKALGVSRGAVLKMADKHNAPSGN